MNARKAPTTHLSDGGVRITVRRIRDTGHAWLVERAHEPRERVWLPRSQIHVLPDACGFDCHQVLIPNWLWQKLQQRI